MAFQAQLPRQLGRPGMGRNDLPGPGSPTVTTMPMPFGRAGLSEMLAGGGLDSFISRLQNQLGEGKPGGPPGGGIDADPGSGGRYGGINPGGGSPRMGAPIQGRPVQETVGRPEVSTLPFKVPETETQPAPAAPVAPAPGSDDAFAEIAEPAAPPAQASSPQATRPVVSPGLRAPQPSPAPRPAPAPRPPTAPVSKPVLRPAPASRPTPAPAPGSDEAFTQIAEKPPVDSGTPWGAAGFGSRREAVNAARKAGWKGDPASQLNEGLKFLQDQGSGGGSTLATKPAKVPGTAATGFKPVPLPEVRMPPGGAPSLTMRPAPANVLTQLPAQMPGGDGSASNTSQFLQGTPEGQAFLRRLETLGISDIDQGLKLAKNRPDSVLGRMYAKVLPQRQLTAY